MKLKPWLLILNLVFINLSAWADDEPLEQQEVTEAVNNLIGKIEQDYLLDEKRGQIVEYLTMALNRGEFNGHFPFPRLKMKLESMLISVSNDSNFEIHWRSGLTSSMEAPDIFFPGAIQTQLLDRDIGYLAIDGDFLNDSWRRDIDDAIEFLSDSKALIIDLRSAGLTSMSFSQYVLSYFIPVGQPLSNLTFGHSKTAPIVSVGTENPVNSDVPVFIVTSPFVAGSWEFVAYTLKHAKRATIVGMPTMGLGYMTTTTKLSEHLSLVMAYAEFQHPETNESWKDIGVLPDVESNADDAMEVTLELVNDAITNNLNVE